MSEAERTTVLLVGRGGSQLTSLRTALEQRGVDVHLVRGYAGEQPPPRPPALVALTGFAAKTVSPMTLRRLLGESTGAIFVLSGEAAPADRLSSLGHPATCIEMEQGEEAVAEQLLQRVSSEADSTGARNDNWADAETVRPPPGALPEDVEQELGAPEEQTQPDSTEGVEQELGAPEEQTQPGSSEGEAMPELDPGLLESDHPRPPTPGPPPPAAVPRGAIPPPARGTASQDPKSPGPPGASNSGGKAKTLLGVGDAPSQSQGGSEGGSSAPNPFAPPPTPGTGDAPGSESSPAAVEGGSSAPNPFASPSAPEASEAPSGGESPPAAPADGEGVPKTTQPLPAGSPQGAQGAAAFGASGPPAPSSAGAQPPSGVASAGAPPPPASVGSGSAHPQAYRQQPPAPKRRSKKGLVIGLAAAVVVVAAGGAGAWVLLSGRLGSFTELAGTPPQPPSLPTASNEPTGSEAGSPAAGEPTEGGDGEPTGPQAEAESAATAGDEPVDAGVAGRDERAVAPEQAPEHAGAASAPQPPSSRAMPEPRIAAAQKADTERDPRESDRVVLDARLQIREGDLAAAERTLQRALELDPQNPRAHASFGQLYVARGDGETALAWLRRAIEARPERVRYQLLLGDALELAGKRADAIRTWKGVLREHPDNSEARDRLREAVL